MSPLVFLICSAVVAAIALYALAARDSLQRSQETELPPEPVEGRGFALAGATMAVGIALIVGGGDDGPESTVRAGASEDGAPAVYRYSGEQGPAWWAALPDAGQAAPRLDGALSPGRGADGSHWQRLQR